jgi:hypothetical protein
VFDFVLRCLCLSRHGAQEGLTCCDEARADGRGDFVAFVLAVQQDLNTAMRRAQGDAHVLRSLVTDVFEALDAGSKAAAAADRPQLPVLPGDGSRKFKFSSSRATLRVKTTVELLLEEQREAAEGGTAAAAAAAAAPPAPKPKPKSRIMFSS